MHLRKILVCLAAGLVAASTAFAQNQEYDVLIGQSNMACQGQDFGIGTIYHDGWIDFNKNGIMDTYEDPDAKLEDRIENLLSQMTVEEKTAQMVTLYGYRRVLQDDLPTKEWKNKLWKDGIGAIDEHLNGFRNWGFPPMDNPYVWPASKHAWALNEVQRFFVEETRLGIPTDFTNEGIRGVEAYIATNFPSQIGLGHTWDRDLVYHVGYITGREARLLGYTNVYAPILDVGRDQRWGRYEEVYGEDPYLVAELGVAMAQGMQTDYQVASTAKHFIAYSNNKGAREGMSRVDPQISAHEIENIHVYPWREVIRRAGILGVMSSYNDIDGYPVQGSRFWLDERLRKDFDFKGYVVSDSDAVEYLHTKHHVSADMKESVFQSVMAGLNVRCTFRTPDSYVLPLRELVNEGKIPMEIIDSRVRDILHVKFLVGLFDKPYQVDYDAADAEVNCQKHNDYALRASRESIVLLKNDGILPLDTNKLKKVAVIGPNADEVSFTHTHYGPLATESISVLEGLKRALDGVATVSYTKGCELVDSNWPLSEIMPSTPSKEELKEIEKAVKLAKKNDAVVLCLGGGVRTCGENKSRTSLELPGHQELLLRELCKVGKPVIVVLLNGRPLSVNYADAYASAILEAWYPGSHGGTAIADILLGKYNPSGKLTVTFPKTVGQIPFNFPYKPNSQIDGDTHPGPDGRQSRINGALYDFGYGLSYTSFEYSDLEISSKAISPGDSVDISFKITNTGSRSGEEIVQLYIRDEISSITRYEKLLRGFQRVSLEAGESKVVRMKLTPEAFTLLDEKFNSIIEPGGFEIMVAASSTDVRLKDRVVISEEITAERFLHEKNQNIEFPVVLEPSEDVTLTVSEGKLIEYLDIEWGEGTDCEFEILWTKGGGQFIPCFKGTISNPGKMHCRFSSVDASEIRVSIIKGRGIIKNINHYSLIN